MKHFSKLTSVIVASIVLGLGFAGCAGEGEAERESIASSTTYSDISTGKIEDTQSENLTSDALITSGIGSEETTADVLEPHSNKYILLNEYGDEVNLLESDQISIMHEFDIIEFTPEEALEQKVFFAEYNGYTYMTTSIGVSYDSRKTAFNSDEYSFIHEKSDEEYDYFKVSTGDKFGDLTVQEASIVYYGGNDILLERDSVICFSGLLTVSGYLQVITEPSVGFETGDILFIVDCNTAGNIPILSPSPHVWNIVDSQNNEFYFSSDISSLNIGNIFEDYDYLDLSMIPLDGSFIYTEIVMTDLEMHMLDSGAGGYWGTLVDVSWID